MSPTPSDTSDAVSLAIQAGSLFLCDNILSPEETGKAILYVVAGLAFLMTFAHKAVVLVQAFRAKEAPRAASRRGRAAAAAAERESHGDQVATISQVEDLRRELDGKFDALQRTLMQQLLDMQRDISRNRPPQ